MSLVHSTVTLTADLLPHLIPERLQGELDSASDRIDHLSFCFVNLRAHKPINLCLNKLLYLRFALPGRPLLSLAFLALKLAGLFGRFRGVETLV